MCRMLKDHIFTRLKRDTVDDCDTLLTLAAENGYGLGSAGDQSGVSSLMVCDSALPVLSLARQVNEKNELVSMLTSVECKGWIVKDSILPGVESILLCRFFKKDDQDMDGWSEEFNYACRSGRTPKGSFNNMFLVRSGVVAVATLKAMVSHPDDGGSDQ